MHKPLYAERDFLFTSESVTEGHPDKMADQVSDALLDALLAKDPHARVALETLLTTNRAVVAGEVTTSAKVDFESIVRQTIKDIGYNSDALGFSANSVSVQLYIGTQSPDISQGVSLGEGAYNKDDQGAGDQGIMFGYAIRESETLMPLTLHLSHRLAERLAMVRKQGTLKFLRPDGKTQVTVEYEKGVPKRVHTVVVSTQHDENVKYEELKDAVREEVIKKVIPSNLIDNKTRFFINPTGRFVIGGPHGDTGLTGRKIIVDTYGGHGAHGGGAFSGKDPSKVDRSAAYMARYVAKNVVASGACDRCMIQVGYAIGVPDPVSVMIETYGTEKVPVPKIEAAVAKLFSFRPSRVIKSLDLLKPIYLKTAAYGHFGREESTEGFAWEKTDASHSLKSLL